MTCARCFVVASLAQACLRWVAISKFLPNPTEIATSLTLLAMTPPSVIARPSGARAWQSQ